MIAESTVIPESMTVTLETSMLWLGADVVVENQGSIELQSSSIWLRDGAFLDNSGAIDGVGVIANNCSSAVPSAAGIAPTVTIAPCRLVCVDECCEEPPEETGCTLTQGYWKNHQQKWASDGELCGSSWAAVLDMSPSGNAWLVLAHQWVASSLNVANGASTPPQVELALDEAASLLEVNCAGFSAADAPEAIALSEVLDDYNNGLVGPGSCPDDEEEEVELE